MASTITDRLKGTNTSTAIKAPVLTASTANLTLSAPQTVDGVSLVAEDRVLVKDQTDASENGIYVVKAGAWLRSSDFNSNFDVVQGTLVIVYSGTASAFMYKVTTANDIDIGTDNITFVAIGLGELGDLSVVLASLATNDTLVYNGTNWVNKTPAALKVILGLTVGTDIQAFDATLTALAGLSTGASKIPYSTGTDAFSQLDLLDEDNMASDSATALATQQSIKAYIESYANSLVVPTFESADQTITFNGSLTIAHGLSSTPKATDLKASIKNVTTDANYVTDDEFPVDTFHITSSTATSQFVVLFADATNIYVRMGNVWTVPDKTTPSTRVNITAANWKLIIRI